MRNVTLSADEDLIGVARKLAASAQTTLNEQFRQWLAHYVGRSRQAAVAAATLQTLCGQLSTGRRTAEMNAR